MGDLDGKVIVITGANTGIGLEAARTLARRGARVLLACRDSEKSRSAVASVASVGEAELIPLDLASLASVRSAADTILAATTRLDVLVLNAGVWPGKREVTKDGFESAMGVNHLGHFLLTHLLLPRLRASAPARIIVVASRIHYAGAIDLDDPLMERGWGSRKAYAASKLANVMFTRELARRLDGSGVTVNAVHPGVVGTELWRFLPRPLAWVTSRVMLTPEQGAQPTIWLATAPELAHTTGRYFDRLVEAEPSEASRDEDAVARLWAWTESVLEIAPPATREETISPQPAD